AGLAAPTGGTYGRSGEPSRTRYTPRTSALARSWATAFVSKPRGSRSMSERAQPEPVPVVADEVNPLRELVACLNTPDPAARLGVARTLQLIGPEAVPELLADLDRAEAGCREAIIGA